MKLKSALLVSLLGLALKLSAQVTLVGYSDVIGIRISESFPSSIMLTQALGQITNAIGNGGDAIITGRDSGGNLIGTGLVGSTTASANFNIGNNVSISVVWTTTISWRPVEGADGFIHIEVTVVWGSNSEGYSRVMDAKTAAPNAVMPANNAPPSGGGGGGGGGSGSGHYELREFFGQYCYTDSNSTFHVVGYFFNAWVWVSDGSGGNQEQY